MFVRIFVCLVLITKTLASGYQTTSQYQALPKYRIYNERNTRKLVTETLNDNPGGAAQSMNCTENQTNATGSSITVVPLISGQNKNRTTTMKPNANKEEMETQSSQIVNSYPPYISYEVTENVVDIPDDRTPAGPIVTNYTHRPPILNLARPTNKTETDKTTEATNIETKKNSLSILHINAEFDDKVHEVHGNKVFGLFKGIKEYIHSFQRGIVNGFHSLFHKHQDVHDHGDRFERAADGHGKSNVVQNEDHMVNNVHRRYVRMK